MNKLIFDYARKCKRYWIDVCGNKHLVYGGIRNRKTVKGIVIHYTGGSSDSAKNECDYFATGINRSASAHIFIDYQGLSGRSLPLNRVAYSVGNPNECYARGKYFATLNNSNTVSIELCGIADRPASERQIETLIKVVKWVKKKCPNIDTICRHYDIVKKECPAYYVEHSTEWKKLKNKLLLTLNEG